MEDAHIWILVLNQLQKSQEIGTDMDFMAADIWKCDLD